MVFLMALLVGSLPALASAEAPTADELLDAMDKALQFDTRTSRSTMTVVDGDRTRSYEMQSFARGTEDAAVEYLAPTRDKGTKMLKKGDDLWLFMPRAERTQKISGHMLRQGMMGSDISYEDMMEAAEFRKRYSAQVLGEEDLGGRPTWKLEAKAKDESVSYPRRVIWIDRETMVPLRQELYALSGMLLKTWEMSDVRLVEGRHTAMKMELADKLRQGSKTVLTLDSVSYGVKLKDEVFTLRWLERK
jgi:outer membrane lipoprotein-sorting protein